MNTNVMSAVWILRNSFRVQTLKSHVLSVTPLILRKSFLCLEWAELKSRLLPGSQIAAPAVNPPAVHVIDIRFWFFRKKVEMYVKDSRGRGFKWFFLSLESLNPRILEPYLIASFIFNLNLSTKTRNRAGFSAVITTGIQRY